MTNTKIDELINKFKEFKEELNKNVNMSYAPAANAAKAEAGHDPKVMSVKKPLAPKDVEDAGPASFKVTVPKDNKAATSQRHPMGKGQEGVNVEDVSLRHKEDKMKIMPMVDKAEGKKVVIHTHKNGQWDLKNEGKKEHASQFSDNKGKTAAGPV